MTEALGSARSRNIGKGVLKTHMAAILRSSCPEKQGMRVPERSTGHLRAVVGESVDGGLGLLLEYPVREESSKGWPSAVWWRQCEKLSSLAES